MRISFRYAIVWCGFMLIDGQADVPNGTLRVQVVTNQSQRLKSKMILSKRHFQKNSKVTK